MDQSIVLWEKTRRVQLRCVKRGVAVRPEHLPGWSCSEPIIRGPNHQRPNTTSVLVSPIAVGSQVKGRLVKCR